MPLIILKHEPTKDQLLAALVNSAEENIQAYQSLFGYVPFGMTVESIVQRYLSDAISNG